MGTASECPYCGARRGSPVGYLRLWLRTLSDPNRPLSYVIMGACGVMFVVTVLLGGYFFGPEGALETLLRPGRTELVNRVILPMGLTGPFVFSHGIWWGVFTSVFSHLGIIHLAFNLYVLSIIGPLLERSVSRSTFWSIFVLSGAGGATLTAFMALTANIDRVAAGASGAIMGILGASLVLGYLSGRDWNDPIMQTLVRWAILIFALGIIVNYVGVGFRIDNWGHLGGFLTGAGLISLWTLVKNNRTYRDTVSPIVGWTLLGVVVVAFLRSWSYFYFGIGL